MRGSSLVDGKRGLRPWRFGFGLLAGLIVLAAGLSGIAAGPAAERAAPRTTAFAAVEPPDVTARSAYVFDASVGTELYVLDADEERAPASLTKVVTALVVLERADLDDVVMIVEEDRVDLTESHVGIDGLLPGDRLTVRDLLAGLLIPSGNDAARALARHIGTELLGGEPSAADAVAAFVAEMNQTMTRLGLSHSNFTNPSGIDDAEHYASARDLGIVTARAMEREIFRELVAETEMVLPSEVLTEGYAIVTTNDLLVEGVVNGVKTGTTGEAGGCLITSMEIGGNRVITVVMGSETMVDESGVIRSPARFDDVRRILSGLDADYRWLDPVATEALAGLDQELKVWETSLPDGPSLVVPSDRADDLRYRLQLGPPAAPNEPAGMVLFFVGRDFLSERPVVQVA